MPSVSHTVFIDKLLQCSWTCFDQRVGPDDFQRSLPAMVVWCLCPLSLPDLVQHGCTAATEELLPYHADQLLPILGYWLMLDSQDILMCG